MKRRSINGKLSRLVVLAIGSSMLLVAAFGCYQEATRYLDGKRETLLATASAFAAASADAVASHDQRAAYLAIRGIASVPTIDFAALHDAAGRPVASIGSGVRLSRDLDITEADREASALGLLNTRTVSVTVPVRSDGKIVGRLTLVGEVSDLWNRLLGVLVTTATGALAALAVGFLISLRLQRSITRPLVSLTKAMASIKTSHDYATQVAIDSDDEVGLLAASFNDMIGEVHERDRRLVAHRDQLEQDVADRTFDLKLAKEEAETANASKSIFLATMSHEIRTPMTGLLVMAELLASGDLPARSRRYAEVISHSGSALLAIINDILDFSKIEAGKLETERVPLNVRDVVNTVVTLFFPRAAEKSLDLAARFAADVPIAIAGDPVRLQQVISNLVNNALKFTKEGHVAIDVRWENSCLVCDVVDTGTGIAEDRLKRIFEAFSQADGSTTREFGGTGLGLTISSRLAEAMGGKISVSSRLGSGSTFTCLIPAEMLEPAPAWPTAVEQACRRAVLSVSGSATRRAVESALRNAGFDVCPAAKSPDTPEVLVVDRQGSKASAVLAGPSTKVIVLIGPGEDAGIHEFNAHRVLRLPFVEDDLMQALEGPMNLQRPAPPTAAAETRFEAAKILVADDTAVNREVMIEALSRFGIVPDLAENGLEALAAATSQRYDLVFMDGSMPELDGFEACRRLRLLETEGQHTIVLALTAHVVGSSADAWRDAGMDGVLYKPFTMRELQRALAAFLPMQTEGLQRDQDAPSPIAVDTPHDTLLDEGVLAEIDAISRDTKHGFAQRVFRLFIEHAPRSWTSVADAAAASDHAALAAAAHAIKSMSLNVGAKRAGLAAAEVERSARAGIVNLAEIKALEDALTLTTADLSDRLRSFGAKTDPATPIERSVS